jgi:hypothetical protein
MAAMSREITTIDIIEEAERHPPVRNMESVTIHDDQTSVRSILGFV